MAERKEETTKYGESEDKRQKSYGWGVRHIQIVCMCACMIVLFLARSSMSVAVLAMTDMSKKNSSIPVYDWDKKTQSIVLTSFFWGYMLMQIPGALLAKKFGGKPVIMVALVINSVLCLGVPIMAKWGGWHLVCLARMCMGLTQACLYPTTHTLMGRWLPSKERTTYSGFVYGGNNLGIIISMPISGLLAETLGWQYIFYSCSVALGAFSIIWWWFTASSPGEHSMMSKEERAYIESDMSSNTPNKMATPWLAILSSKEFWAIVVSHVGCTMFYMFYFNDLPTYLEKGLKISLNDSSSLAALPYVGMWLGNILSAFFYDKIVDSGFLSQIACRKIFNSIAFFGVASGLLGMSFISGDQKWLAVSTLVGSLTFGGFICGGFMVNHLDLSPNFAGVLLSLTNTAANIGCIMTPLLISVILHNDPTDLNQWRIVFLMIASTTVIANLYFITFASADVQPWNDPLYKEKNKNCSEEMRPVLKIERRSSKILERRGSVPI